MKIESGGNLPLRRLLIPLVLFILIGVGGLLWLRSRDASAPAATAAPTVAPIIERQPPVVSTRRFDPANPPAEMPPLHPGEQAQCESNFMSSAIVSGQPRRISSTTATLTVTQVKMALQMAIVIWVPDGVTQKVLDHEEGHRQISEFYYQNADEFAARIAASYIGRQYEVTGPDPQAAANQMLQQIGSDITAEYSNQLDADAAQLRYDAITDHARNDVAVRDAIAEVLKE